MITAREKIEIFQAELYTDFGIAPENLKAKSLALAKSLLAETGSDSSISIFEGASSRKEITEFQDVIQIAEILQCWDYVIDANNDELAKIANPNSNPENIVIGTAPSGDLNARAVLGKDGSKGILIESELLMWSMVFSSLIVDFFIHPPIVQSSIDAPTLKHPSDITFFAGKSTSVSKLLSLLVHTVSSGKVSSDFFVKGETFQQRKLCELARSGMISFVLGHEYSHLVYDHHNDSNFNVNQEAIDNVTKIFELYAETLEGIVTFSGEERLRSYVAQSNELKADYHGYRYALNAAKNYDDLQTSVFDGVALRMLEGDEFSLLFYEMGILLFHWSIELLERTICVLSCGKQRSENPIFEGELLLQNVLLRKTHPCPLSRIDNMCKNGTDLGKEISKWLEILFENYWKIISPHITKAHEAGYRPNAKWINPSTEFAITLQCVKAD